MLSFHHLSLCPAVDIKLLSNPLSFRNSSYAGVRNEAILMLLFASYWERGVKVAESVGVYVYVYVYVYAVIRRGIQVCVCVSVCV